MQLKHQPAMQLFALMQDRICDLVEIFLVSRRRPHHGLARVFTCGQETSR
jgi:hypothetical protein